MKFIREYTDDIIVESEINEETKEKSWYIKGVTLQSEIKNKNGRIYPKAVLEKAVNEYVENQLNKNTVNSLGEMNHPKIEPYIVNMENATHKFIEIKEDGNNWVTKAKVLNTPKGKIVQDLLSEGIKIGISSRGFGEIKEENGVKKITQFALVTAGDLVSNPSAPDAWIEGVMEDTEWVYENGCWNKSECKIEEKIENVKKEIDLAYKKASVEERQQAILKIWQNYINEIFGNLKSK